MHFREAKKRIIKLKKEIEKHRYDYHVLNKSEISEGALDSLKDELYKIEILYPELVTLDSPTQRVSGEPLKNFSKKEHNIPMMSLFDIFSEQDLINWKKRLEKIIISKYVVDDIFSYFCELKLDGIAASLIYKNKIFQSGATRGNGKIGEDVSNNLRTIESIPLILKVISYDNLFKIGFNKEEIDIILNSIKNNLIEIRGEVIMKKSVFDDLNKKYKREGKSILSNPRNAAAGSIRQLDSRLTHERNLNFYAYELIINDNLEDSIKLLKTQERKINLLGLLGFKVLSENKFCKDLNEVQKFHSFWEKKKNDLDFYFDGVVIKINNLLAWNILGSVGKGPRYAMAYKFSSEQKTTMIESVDWQIGRTGVLTPIANLDPVKIGGVLVSKATLHNCDEIKRLDIKNKDTVIVERAGDVIPKIIKVLKNLRNGDEKDIIIPQNCPKCNQILIKKKDEVAFRCNNDNCPQKKISALIHWVSKDAFDIVGLGEKVVKHLFQSGLIRDVSDFYKLKVIDIQSLDGFAKKSAENLINSINAKRNIDLSKFLYALGINNIGKETAWEIAMIISNNYSQDKITVSELMNFFSDKDNNYWENIKDIGPIVSKSICNFWNNIRNLNILEKLNSENLNLDLIKKNKGNLKLENKKFVITGTLANYSRNEIIEKIRENGGSIISSVSSNVDFLLCGKNPGNKMDKAKKNNIKIISEQDFLNLI